MYEVILTLTILTKDGQKYPEAPREMQESISYDFPHQCRLQASTLSGITVKRQIQIGNRVVEVEYLVYTLRTLQ